MLGAFHFIFWVPIFIPPFSESTLTLVLSKGLHKDKSQIFEAISRMAEWETQQISPPQKIKAVINQTKLPKTTILGLWKLTKGTQQIEKHLFKKNYWTSVTTEVCDVFSLELLPSPATQFHGLWILPQWGRMWGLTALLPEGVYFMWSKAWKNSCLEALFKAMLS